MEISEIHVDENVSQERTPKKELNHEEAHRKPGFVIQIVGSNFFLRQTFGYENQHLIPKEC